jgi:hypothetical protein
MDRSVSVNVQSDRDTSEFESGFPPDGPPAGDFPLDVPTGPPGKIDLGPCLYLGPAGQRCDRRAADGSFCLRHQPDSISEASRIQLARRSLAVIGVLAVLWPVLADLIRELIRFFR